MVKLKPIEEMFTDADKFDLVRIQLDIINEFVGYVKRKTHNKTIFFCHNCPVDCIVDSNSRLIVSEFKMHDTTYENPLGYEVLRRYKGE